MSKKSFLSIVLSAVMLLSLACSALAVGQSGRYIGNSTVNGSIYQTYYQVDAKYKMCESSGHIKSQTSKYLKGDWDLTGGFSGGPLVEYISGSGYVAIGIHKDGSTVDGSQYPTSYTGALRITQSLYTLFLSYRGE